MFLIISGPSYESIIHGYVTDERVAQDIINDNTAKFTVYSEYWRKRNKLQHEYPQYSDMIIRECGPVPDYIENLRYEEVKPYA